MTTCVCTVTLGGKPRLPLPTNRITHTLGIRQRQVPNRSSDCSHRHLMLGFLINFLRPWPLLRTERSYAVRIFYCKIKSKGFHTPKPTCFSFYLLHMVRWNPLHNPTAQQYLLQVIKALQKPLWSQKPSQPEARAHEPRRTSSWPSIGPKRAVPAYS